MGSHPQLHAADDAVRARSLRRSLTSRCVRCSISHRDGTHAGIVRPSIERGSASISRRHAVAGACAARPRGLKQCSVRQGDIYNLALPRESFDVVLVHQVLHFLEDGARAIREAARVLTPSAG